jgi:hypothetical protein
MNEYPPTTERPFHVHLMRLDGSRRDPALRVLLIETNGARIVYEGLASWSEILGWIQQLSSMDISVQELAVLRNLLGRKRLAIIKEVRVSPCELESLELRRADS